MRIAYVEDNLANMALVERIARADNHTIVPYSEGEIALEALALEPYDLILMDIELAGEVSGLDVVRHLRSLGNTTPIVAVTAYAMMGDRDRCLEAGCDDYLPKPIPVRDLLALFARYRTPRTAPTPAAPAVSDLPSSPAPLPVTGTSLPSSPATPAEGTRPVLEVPMLESAQPAELGLPAPSVETQLIPVEPTEVAVPGLSVSADAQPVEPASPAPLAQTQHAAAET